MTCNIKDSDKFYPQLFLEEALYNKKTQRKPYKKGLSKEVMLIAWHRTRSQGWCFPEDEKKGIGPSFTEKFERNKNVFSVHPQY